MSEKTSTSTEPEKPATKTGGRSRSPFVVTPTGRVVVNAEKIVRSDIAKQIGQLAERIVRRSMASK